MLGSVQSLGAMVVYLHANTVKYVNQMNMAEKVTVNRMASISKAVKFGAAAVAAAVATMSVASVKSWVQFEKSMTQSTAIMTGVTASLRKEMELTARSVATQTTTSAVEAADAYFYLASAGLSAKEAIGALPVVNKFAIAGQFDMARATDLVTDAQSALGLNVGTTADKIREMTRVSDVLVKANTLANATVEQFSISLTSKAGAAIKSFNKDIEEGVAVLAAMADQGIKAELAGNALDRIIRLLANSSRNAAAEHKRFGFEVFDAAGNMRNMADIVANLESVLDGMSAETKSATLELLGFDARVQGVILPLLGTSDAIRKYEENLRSAGGTTGDIADKQMKSFSDQMKILWNQFKEGLLIVGEQLTPVLRELIAVFGEGTGGAETYYKVMRTFGKFLRDTLVVSIGMVGEAINFWRIIGIVVIGVFKDLMEAGKGVGTGLSKAFIVVGETIQDIMKLALKPFIWQVNGVIRAINVFRDEADKFELISSEDLLNIDAAKKKMESFLKTLTSGDGMKHTRAAIEKAKNIPLFGESGFYNRFKNREGLSLPDTPFQVDPMTDPEVQAAQGVADAIVAIEEDKQNQIAEIQDKARLRTVNGLKSLLTQEQQAIVANSETILTGLSSIARDVAGEQTGIFKALFAASKAFAIADSIIKIQQAIANASAVPFPAKLGAIAQVVSLTAGIVSTIKSTQLGPMPSFLGGGFTGMGARSGGIDGQGGFLSVLHPKERVIDMEKGGGGSIINIYNNAGVDVRTTEDRDGVNVFINKLEDRLSSNVAEGRGRFSKTLERTYKLRR